MSSAGGVGGAYYDLNVNTQAFRTDLEEAREIAREMAREIGQALDTGLGTRDKFDPLGDTNGITTKLTTLKEGFDSLYGAIQRADGALGPNTQSIERFGAAYADAAQKVQQLDNALRELEGRRPVAIATNAAPAGPSPEQLAAIKDAEDRATRAEESAAGVVRAQEQAAQRAASERRNALALSQKASKFANTDTDITGLVTLPGAASTLAVGQFIDQSSRALEKNDLKLALQEIGRAASVAEQEMEKLRRRQVDVFQREMNPRTEVLTVREIQDRIADAAANGGKVPKYLDRAMDDAEDSPYGDAFVTKPGGPRLTPEQKASFESAESEYRNLREAMRAVEQTANMTAEAQQSVRNAIEEEARAVQLLTDREYMLKEATEARAKAQQVAAQANVATTRANPIEVNEAKEAAEKAARNATYDKDDFENVNRERLIAEQEAEKARKLADNWRQEERLNAQFSAEYPSRLPRKERTDNIDYVSSMFGSAADMMDSGNIDALKDAKEELQNAVREAESRIERLAAEFREIAAYKPRNPQTGEFTERQLREQRDEYLAQGKNVPKPLDAAYRRAELAFDNQATYTLPGGKKPSAEDAAAYKQTEAQLAELRAEMQKLSIQADAAKNQIGSLENTIAIEEDAARKAAVASRLFTEELEAQEAAQRSLANAERLRDEYEKKVAAGGAGGNQPPRAGVAGAADDDFDGQPRRLDIPVKLTGYEDVERQIEALKRDTAGNLDLPVRFVSVGDEAVMAKIAELRGLMQAASVAMAETEASLMNIVTVGDDALLAVKRVSKAADDAQEAIDRFDKDARTLGGKSISVGTVDLEEFNQSLQQAYRAAQRAVAAIVQVFTEMGNAVQGQLRPVIDGLGAASRSAVNFADAVEKLPRGITDTAAASDRASTETLALAAAYDAAALAATSLAAAQGTLAAARPAQGAAPAAIVGQGAAQAAQGASPPAATPPVVVAGATPAGQPANAPAATPANTVAQAQQVVSTMQAVTTAARTATVQATASAKDVLAAQTNLNTFVRALIQDNPDEPRAGVGEAIDKTRDALTALQASDPGAALQAIDAASAAARAEIAKLNDEIEKMQRGGRGKLSILTTLDELEAEILRLNAAQEPIPSNLYTSLTEASEGRSTSYLVGGGNIGDALQADQEEEKALARLNALNSTLTQGTKQLEAARTSLTTQTKEQARATQELVEQQQAEARARAYYAEIQNNPQLAQRGINMLNARTTLAGAGLEPEEASRAIGSLGASLSDLDKATGIKNLEIGLRGSRDAVRDLTQAFDYFGQGQVQNGLIRTRDAINSIDRALLSTRLAKEQLDRQMTNRAPTEEERRYAQALAQRSTALQAARRDAEALQRVTETALQRNANTTNRDRANTVLANESRDIVRTLAPISDLAGIPAQMEALGISTKGAQNAANGLQAALTNVNKALSANDLKIGTDRIREAADELESAMSSAGAGDRVQAFQTELGAVERLRQAEAELAVAAGRIRDEYYKGNIELEEMQRRLREVAAIRTPVQSAIRSAESSIAGFREPEIAAEKELQKQVENTAKKIREQRREAQANTFTVASGSQDVLRAVGFQGTGQFVGGAGRAAAAFNSLANMGVDEVYSTARMAGPIIALTAVGAAITKTTQAGLAFNEMLDVAGVRLAATESSASTAARALEDISTKATGDVFGFLDPQDLAKGNENLRRIGFDSEAMQKRIANATAATGRTYYDVAQQIGHFYDVVKQGQPFGDIALSLERSGIITSETGKRLRAAAADGDNFQESVKIIDEALDRLDGTAEKMTGTMTGSFQRLKNDLNVIAGLAYKPIFEPMSAAVTSLAEVLSSPKIGQGIAWFTKIETEALKAISPVAQLVKAVGELDDVLAKLQGRDPAKKTTDEAKTAAEKATQSAYVSAPTPDTLQAAYNIGAQTTAAYVKGFDEQANEEFAKLDDYVLRHFQSLQKNGQFTYKLAQSYGTEIQPLLAKMVDETQRLGAVTDTTANEAKRLLGEEATEVLNLADKYAKLRAAKEGSDKAETQITNIENDMDVTRTTAGNIATIDQKAIDDAEAVAKKNADTFDLQIALQKTFQAGLRATQENLNDLYDGQREALQEQITDAQKETERLALIAKNAIAEMQETLQSYQEGVDERRAKVADDIEKMQNALSQRQEQISDRRQSAGENIEGMQTALSQRQEEIAERRRQVAEEIEEANEALSELQEKAQSAQEAMSEHQAAFNAVLNGTIDQFNKEHQQQDDITRAIIAKWEAEIGGARRAKQATDAALQAQTAQENIITLAYERRIAAARAAGNIAQATALAEQRDRVLAQQRQNSAVTRAEAAVNNDRAQSAQQRAERAAGQQGSDDRAAVNAINAEVKAQQEVIKQKQESEKATQKLEDAEIRRAQQAIKDAQDQEKAIQKIEDAEIKRSQRAIKDAQDEEKAIQKVEDAEIKRQQRAITEAQRVESVRAANAAAEIKRLQDEEAAIRVTQKAMNERFNDQIAGIDKTIKKIQDEALAQKIKDDQAIADAKAIKEFDDKYFKDKLENQGKDLANAKLLKQQYDEQVVALGGQITALDQVAQRIDAINAKELTHLNLLRAMNGLPAIPDLATFASSPNLSVPPIPPESPINNRGGNGPGETNANGPRGDGNPTKPLLPSNGSRPPEGYHAERDSEGNTWFVPDGFTLRDFGKMPDPNQPGSRNSVAAPESAPARGVAAAATGDWSYSRMAVPDAGDFARASAPIALSVGGAGLGALLTIAGNTPPREGGAIQPLVIHNDFGGMIVREEADINKIAGAVNRMNEESMKRVFAAGIRRDTL